MFRPVLWLASFLTVFHFPFAKTATAATKAPSKPNILLILTDDQGYGDWGCTGHPLLESKNPQPWHEDRLLFQHVGRWPGGLAAEHKHAMAAVRQGHHILVSSRPCDSPDCNTDSRGFQCVTLRNVEKGAKDAQYTVGNAAHHWGVTPPDRWALYDLKKDPACQNDLAESRPDLAAKLATAYDEWWNKTYPVMVERGGDSEIEWSAQFLKIRDKNSATEKNSLKQSNSEPESPSKP